MSEKARVTAKPEAKSDNPAFHALRPNLSQSTLSPFGIKPLITPLVQRRIEQEDRELSGRIHEDSCNRGDDASNISEGHDFSRVRVYPKGTVGGLPIQPKLWVNEPGDLYEQEADRVAEQVVRMRESDSLPSFIHRPLHRLQRKKTEESWYRVYEGEETNKSDDYVVAGISQKIGVRTNNSVVLVSPGASYKPPKGWDLDCFIRRNGTAIKFWSFIGWTQEKTNKDVKKEFKQYIGKAKKLLEKNPKPEEATQPPIQRAATSSEPIDDVMPVVNEVVRSEGLPLDNSTRAFMESRFGHNFTNVRVHTDSRATEAARAVNARAFTMGRDVVFGKGEYAPEAIQGKRLLAHELTHTIQQTGTRSHLFRATRPESPMMQRQEVKEKHESALQGVAKTEPMPRVDGKFLGVWKELYTSAKFKGGEEIKRPGKTKGESEEGFATFQEALVYAGVVIASRHADGGVIIKQGDRFYAFTIISDAWVYDFSRKNVEEGFDEVLISGSEVKGIQAFVTIDGHAVYIVKHRKPAGYYPMGYYHSTKAPEAEGFQTVLKDIKEGRAFESTEKGYVALFKGLLKAKALAQLEKNIKRLDEEEHKYFSSEQAKVQLGFLRQIILKDKELASYQEDIKKRMKEAV
jgi:hypothetical protein